MVTWHPINTFAWCVHDFQPIIMQPSLYNCLPTPATSQWHYTLCLINDSVLPTYVSSSHPTGPRTTRGRTGLPLALTLVLIITGVAIVSVVVIAILLYLCLCLFSYKRKSSSFSASTSSSSTTSPSSSSPSIWRRVQRSLRARANSYSFVWRQASVPGDSGGTTEANITEYMQWKEDDTGSIKSTGSMRMHTDGRDNFTASTFGRQPQQVITMDWQQNAA